MRCGEECAFSTAKLIVAVGLGGVRLVPVVAAYRVHRARGPHSTNSFVVRPAWWTVSRKCVARCASCCTHNDTINVTQRGPLGGWIHRMAGEKYSGEF